MPDMLVKLYSLDYKSAQVQLSQEGIMVKKAWIGDKDAILKFVRDNFKDELSWANECEYALFNNPVSCYIAVKNKEIIGFACYEATAKGFFGPMGVRADCRKKGVGAELLTRSLLSMKEAGYAYAIIGWPASSAIEFYKKQVDAVIIEGALPNKSIYKNSIAQE